MQTVTPHIVLQCQLPRRVQNWSVGAVVQSLTAALIDSAPSTPGGSFLTKAVTMCAKKGHFDLIGIFIHNGGNPDLMTLNQGDFHWTCSALFRNIIFNAVHLEWSEITNPHKSCCLSDACNERLHLYHFIALSPNRCFCSFDLDQICVQSCPVVSTCRLNRNMANISCVQGTLCFMKQCLQDSQLLWSSWFAIMPEPTCATRTD